VRAGSYNILIIVGLISLGTSKNIAQTRGAAAPVEITGQVRYAAGGAPADNVLVTCEIYSGGGLIGQILTDRSGKFDFRNLSPAIYTVSVKAAGYREVKQNADLQTMTRSYLQVQLVAENPSTPTAPGRIVDSGVGSVAQAEFEKGKTELLEEKKLESGIGHLEKAVAADPKYLDARLLLANAYVETGNWEKAEKHAQSAIGIDPKQPAGYLTLGEVYRRQQKYQQAEQTLQEVLKLDPKSVQGHFELAQVYFAQGDLAKAGPQIGTVLQLKPDFAEAHLLAGNILLKARQPEGALQMFQEYLRLQPNGPAAAQTKDVVEKIKKALAEKKP
jgi:cytochrome c-type biogenesis protein CcmH/NrfG